MSAYVDYMIQFLLGEENQHLSSLVSYGGESNTGKVIIKPSDFFHDDIFLSKDSIPQLPLKELEDIPILFGEPEYVIEDGQVVLSADIIAGTFFLITRYEECVKRKVRDEHGRFPGTESLAYQAGFLQRPIVDEYGALLRKCLSCAGVKLVATQKKFQHIYLTHDVDNIWTWDNYYRASRTSLKNILKNKPKKMLPLKAVYDYKKYDPIYTFPELVQWDQEVKVKYQELCTDIYFVMSCSDSPATVDCNYMKNKTKHRALELFQYLKEEGCSIGLHSSYHSSMALEEIQVEKERVEEIIGKPVTTHRNHYLASREPEDFMSLIASGITDDFTMGFADQLGFRLSTTRNVRWIHPITKELTPLTLHPMTVMECTLDSSNYMNIPHEDRAFDLVKAMIDQIYHHGGEVVLLWHNPSVVERPESYQRSLYQRLLKYCTTF